MILEQKIEILEKEICGINRQIADMRKVIEDFIPAYHRPDTTIQPSGLETAPTLERNEAERNWEVVYWALIDWMGPYQPGTLIPYELPNCSTIHSVCRKSDGEVFEVGETINHANASTPEDIIIARFCIVEGKMYANPGDVHDRYALIDYWVKKKPLLFTTADGVAVKEGDTVYNLVRRQNYYTGSIIAIKADSEILKYGTIYSTREAAEIAYEKWLYLQPVLTIDDIKLSTPLSSIEFRSLIEKVKHKLKDAAL